jgi:Protein of unknown function (DUF3224)
MKRLALTLIILVVLLSVFTLPAQAAKPTPAAGLWRYISTILESWESGGNLFFITREDGTWAGTFNGTSVEDGKVVIHRTGDWSFNAIVHFTGTVEGKAGTLEMSVVGKKPAGTDTEWEGLWVILSGTGELANLHGQGPWWGPGAPGPAVWGDIPYGGQIHFEP